MDSKVLQNDNGRINIKPLNAIIKTNNKYRETKAEEEDLVV
jgi:hypothetical protein